MGEDARRLVGIDLTRAPRAQMLDYALDASLRAREYASAPPGNRIDVRVDLRDALRRRSRARAEAGQPREARRRQHRDEVVGDAVPRRHQNGVEAVAERGREALASARELGDARGQRPVATELGSALARSRVIHVRVAVLDDRRFAAPGDRLAKRRLD